MAGTIGLTAREGRRGVTGTCRISSPHDSCRSSRVPSTQHQVVSVGSSQGQGLWVLSPRLDHPSPSHIPLKHGQPLPFGSRPCLGPSAFQSFSLGGYLTRILFLWSLTSLTPAPALHTKLTHHTHPRHAEPNPHCAPRPGFLHPLEARLDVGYLIMWPARLGMGKPKGFREALGRGFVPAPLPGKSQ